MHWPTGSCQAASTVHPEVGHRINFTSAAATGRSLNRRIDGETHTTPALRTRAPQPKQTPTPTPQELEKFYRDLYNTSTNSAILSVLPEYCEEFRDQFLPIRSLQSLAKVGGPGLDRSDLSALLKYCQIVSSIADVSEEQAVADGEKDKGTAQLITLVCRTGRHNHGLLSA